MCSFQFAAAQHLQLRAWPILRTGLRPVQLFLVVFCFLQVKEALAVLIIQNMASFRVNEKAGGIAEYSCIIGNVISRIRFEKYILCVKKKHGDVAELIMHELLLHGQTSVNQIVDSVIEKLGMQGESV